MNDKAYQAFSRMTDAEWTSLLLRLGRYAARTAANLRWRTKNKVDLPGGETAASIVSKAIAKVMTGERKWDPDKDPDLGKYLMDVIDSLLSQLVNSDDNRKFRTIPETRDENGDPIPDTLKPRPAVGTEWMAKAPLTPEDQILHKERQDQNDEILGMLAAECSSDPPLKSVLEAMFDGYEAPRDIAQRTGLDVKDVYKAQKRLDTKIDSLRKRVSAGIPPAVLKGERK